jgi:ketosteroid isomerase-like protein
MKTMLFILPVLFLCSGYAGPEPVPAMQQDDETVKKEVREVAGTLLINLANRDADALFSLYADAGDCVFIMTDGNMVNLQEFKNHNIAWFGMLTSLKVTTTRDEIRLLCNNQVLYSWMGSMEMTLGNGQQVTISKFGISFIFSKTGNEWKVVYQQSSALPPA